MLLYDRGVSYMAATAQDVSTVSKFHHAASCVLECQSGGTNRALLFPKLSNPIPSGTSHFPEYTLRSPTWLSIHCDWSRKVGQCSHRAVSWLDSKPSIRKVICVSEAAESVSVESLEWRSRGHQSTS